MSWNKGRGRGNKSRNYKHTLTIRNLPKGVTFPEVQQFLNSNTNSARWGKISFQDHKQSCLLYFGSQLEMQPFLNLQGRIWKGCQLDVAEGFGGKTAASRRTFTKPLNLGQKNQLQEAVGKCWDASKGLLSLGGFIPNPNPNSQWLTFDNMKFCEPLIDILEANCKSVTAMDLSGNGISTLQGLMGLRRGTPQLKCLCLLNNPIQDFREFDHIQKFRDQLTEIKLCSEILLKRAGHALIYQDHLLARFPCLELIDGKAVQPPIDLTASIPKSLLPAAQESHIPENFSNIVQSFLQSFFNAIDNDRNSLGQFYTDNSMFSFTLNAMPDTDSKKGSFSGGYLKHNRNLKMVKSAEPRSLKTLYIGTSNIAKFYKDLHSTQHQFPLLVVDANAVPTADLLQITTSGYYREEERGKQAVFRKFHRFITLVANQNSKHQVSIVNDQLNIGECVKTLDECSMPGSMKDKFTDLVEKIAAHCGCATNVAKEALERANNDPHQAVQLIQNLPNTAI